MSVAEIKQVGHFVVAPVALSGRGDNHDAARVIGAHNVAHLLKLYGVSKRASSKFCCFDHMSS